MATRLIIDNALTVIEPSADMIKWAQERLILNNPDYIKKQKLGKWLGSTPREIMLYDKIGDTIVLPFGCLREFWKMFGNSVTYSNRLHCQTGSVNYESGIKLFDYQTDAVDACVKIKNGVLVMPCGSGKTVCGLEVVSRVGGRALWLTHTQDLLSQSKKRAESVLGIDRRSYGSITAGKVDIGKGLTFATVQTMCKLDLSKYKNVWDIIIVDECQHCAGSPTRVTQFYKVMSSLSARYKIGLTATPKRADGLERSMFALLGDVIHTVSKEAVREKTCPVKVRFIETGYQPDYNAILMGDGTLDYSAIIDELISDQNRLQLVVDTINSLDGTAIVLANRVAYLKDMQERVSKKSVCLSAMGQSKTARATRKKALEDLNDGNIDVIFSTYQLAKEGLDVPSLRYVVFATPEKDETTVTQSAGRVGRKANGKEFGTVIDFVDNFGLYKSWQKKRLSFYKKIG